MPGRAIIYWTKTEEESHNKYHFADGTELEIVDGFDPNNYSLETATVAASNNPFLQPGDKVLIDFSVFTNGKKPHLQMTDVTNRVGYYEDKFFYCVLSGFYSYQ